MSSLLVVVLLSGLALSNTTVSRPLSGGTYIEAIIGTPAQLIPLMPRPQPDAPGYDLDMLLFDGLTRVGPDGLPAPALADSWEISPDGTVYTFRLRRDVVWHDGQPFTASDVLFTLETIQGKDFVGPPALANVWRNVLVDRLDDYTVRCTLNAPYAPFLSDTRLPILPAHLLEATPMSEWGDSAFARQPVGTGPYTLAEITPDHALLEANPTYFGGVPYINRIELRFVESPQATFAALARSDIQAFGYHTTPELRSIALPERINQFDMPLDSYDTLTFNLRQPPLDDVQLRQALARGLDKDALVQQATDGAAVRLDTPILTGWWAYDPSVRWHDYDPQGAAETLESLGYTLNADDGNEDSGIRTRDGQTLAFTLITDSDPARLGAAQEIARQWEVLGVQVEVAQLESDELRQRLRDHDFSLAVHGWTRLGPDPDVFALWHSSQAPDGLNYAGLQDDTIDQVLLNGRRETDLVSRSEDYRLFQQRWVELVPAITLYQPRYTFASSDEVQGQGFDTRGIGTAGLMIGREDRYRSIQNWFLNSSQEIRGTLPQP